MEPAQEKIFKDCGHDPPVRPQPGFFSGQMGYSLLRDWNFQGGERKSFYFEFPYEKDGVTFDNARDSNSMTAEGYFGRIFCIRSSSFFTIFFIISSAGSPASPGTFSPRSCFSSCFSSAKNLGPVADPDRLGRRDIDLYRSHARQLRRRRGIAGQPLFPQYLPAVLVPAPDQN